MEVDEDESFFPIQKGFIGEREAIEKLRDVTSSEQGIIFPHPQRDEVLHQRVPGPSKGMYISAYLLALMGIVCVFAFLILSCYWIIGSIFKR